MAACGDSVCFAFGVLLYLWDIYSLPSSEEINVIFSSSIYIFKYGDVWVDSIKKNTNTFDHKSRHL